jgi:hypothetical protein
VLVSFRALVAEAVLRSEMGEWFMIYETRMEVKLDFCLLGDANFESLDCQDARTW